MVRVMPSRPHKPCAQRGCKELTKSKYCVVHTESEKPIDRHKQSSHQRGYTSKWRKYRAAYLVKPENQLCKLRLSHRCSIKAECVDHIIPPNGNYELFWATNNHQPACIRCNSIKGHRTIRAGQGSDLPPSPEKSSTPPGNHDRGLS